MSIYQIMTDQSFPKIKIKSMPSKKFFLGTFLILSVVTAFYGYVHYLEHRCDSLCVTILNNRNIPVLFEKQGTVVLVGTGAADGSVISQLGKLLPFYERDIDVLILLESSSSTIISTQDILKKYNVKQMYTATSSIAVRASFFEIKPKIFKSLSHAKNAKDKRVVEVSVDTKKFIFDVDTTISQKQFGFGTAEMIFLKNMSIAKTQEKHAVSFAVRTKSAYVISTSKTSSREVKYKRLFDVLRGLIKSGTASSTNFITDIQKDIKIIF